METVSINFTDFWPGFDPDSNYFYRLLSQHYNVVLSDTPDFLFYSVFGKEYRRYKCRRIFFTGENIRPDFNECDYAFTFDHLDHPGHYRLPLYGLYMENPEVLIKKGFDPEAVLRRKTKFCNFVYSNYKAEQRIHFFHKLSKYKQIDAGGRVLNNVGGRVPDKQKFIADYKFTIAFENFSHSGYTTEKLIEPMLVHSLPIYWGNPLVAKDFNPKSFLNYYDFPNEDAFIERIIALDQNDDLYLEYLRQPYYHNNRVNDYINPDNVLRQLDYIINDQRIPIAQQKRRWFSFPISGKGTIAR